jgi:hypothetical protein
MPKGLAVIADGTDAGGDRLPTHHTIYPTERMLYLRFSQLFLNLPWTNTPDNFWNDIKSLTGQVS